MKRLMTMTVAVAMAAATNAGSLLEGLSWGARFDGVDGNDMTVWTFRLTGTEMPVFGNGSFDPVLGTLITTGGISLEAQEGARRSYEFGGTTGAVVNLASWYGSPPISMDECYWYAMVVMLDAPGYEGLYGIDVFRVFPDDDDLCMATAWAEAIWPEQSANYSSIEDLIDALKWDEWGYMRVGMGQYARQINYEGWIGWGWTIEYGGFGFINPSEGAFYGTNFFVTPEDFFKYTIIPEPATGLLALAGIALLIRRKRK